MLRKTDNITTQQTAMLVALALHEKGRGLGDLLPMQVTRGFFKEILVIPIWQSFHQENLNLLVMWGWLTENVATHGTVYYALTGAGRNNAEGIIARADTNCVAFIPQSRTLFDISEER